jgi:hypothetical protein
MKGEAAEPRNCDQNNRERYQSDEYADSGSDRHGDVSGHFRFPLSERTSYIMI